MKYRAKHDIYLTKFLSLKKDKLYDIVSNKDTKYGSESGSIVFNMIWMEDIKDYLHIYEEEIREHLISLREDNLGKILS